MAHRSLQQCTAFASAGSVGVDGAWKRLFRLVVLPPLLMMAQGGTWKQDVKETASNCPPRYPRYEGETKKFYDRVYKEWPPRVMLPGFEPMKESKKWADYHSTKELGLMELEDRQWRWERWLEQVQIRMLKNYTEKGWGMTKMPKGLHKTVLAYFQKNSKRGRDEGAIPGYVTGSRDMIGLGQLKSEVTSAVQKIVAEWTGYKPEELEATSTYGIRVYYNQSTLLTHVDSCETHILSAVYCVDAKYPKGAEKWMMETDPDLRGEHVAVDIQPGDIFLYESAKVAHGRPTKLQGDYSAHIFVHFAPKGFSYTNWDRVFAVPPWWSTGERDGHADIDLMKLRKHAPANREPMRDEENPLPDAPPEL